MGLLKRLRSWRSERKDHLVCEDFPELLNERGNLEILTPFGLVEIDGKMRYDRVTGAYDTEYKEIHLASCLHDYGCNEMKKNGCVKDMAGSVIMTTQRQVDIAFLMEMLRAVRLIVMKQIQKQEPLGGFAKNLSTLLLRVVVYYKGVRKWHKLMRLLGKRDYD